MLRTALACLITLPVLAVVPRAALPGFTEQSGGLRVADMKPGKGAEAKVGQTAKVLYRGWLYDTAKGRQGKLFDQHQDKRKPFRFPLGGGKVIKGWDQGVVGMKVGGKRVLILPPELAYGEKGAKDDQGEFVIPPGATLLFEVELLGLEEGSNA